MELACGACAANNFALFDDGGPMPGLSGLDGGALSGRAGTNDDEVVGLQA